MCGMIYYRTPLFLFKRPTDGVALFIGEGGDTIILSECGENVLLATAIYTVGPVHEELVDDQFSLARYPGLVGVVFHAAESERFVALYECAVSQIPTGPLTFVLYEKERTEVNPTSGSKYEFGLAAFSWFPEELKDCERSLIHLSRSLTEPATRPLPSSGTEPTSPDAP